MMEFYSQLVGQIYTNKITENDWRFEIWLLFLIYKVKWYFYKRKLKNKYSQEFPRRNKKLVSIHVRDGY